MIAGVMGDLSRMFRLSPGALGLTVSSALFGTLAGSLGARASGDRFGSRDVLAVTAVFCLMFAFGCALATSLAAFRVLGGIAI